MTNLSRKPAQTKYLLADTDGFAGPFRGPRLDDVTFRSLNVATCLCNLKLNELNSIFNESVFVTFIFGAANTAVATLHKSGATLHKCGATLLTFEATLHKSGAALSL